MLDTVCTDPILLDEWHVIAYARELTPGTLLPTRLLGRDLVAWRDAEGQAHVWEDLCIYRGARLSKGWITENTVVCPYHGWRYNGTGACVLIPAAPGRPIPPKARSFPVKAIEQDGLIWASLGTPAHLPPAFPERNTPGFRTFLAGPYKFQANGFRAVENFIDITHFPFVHAGFNGVPGSPDVIADYDVTQTDQGLTSSEIIVFQPVGDFRRIPVRAGYTYSTFRPLVAYFSKRLEIADPENAHLGAPNDRFTTFFTAQPIDDVTCIARVVFAINFAPHLTEADMLPRQDTIFTKDRDIVETQRPERIPTDLREEMHHRTDKMGVAYRRWLRDLGVTYDTL